MTPFRSSKRRMLLHAVESLSLLIATASLAQAQGLFSGSGSAAEAASTPNSAQPSWVYRATPNGKRAIVFVHGLFGHTLDTWKNAKAGRTFFELIKNTDSGKDFDIFAFGFTSNFFDGGSLTPLEAAQTLRSSLKANGVTSYSSVVFVAHSMGGLVVMDYLLGDPDMAAKVPFIALYATPQEGAQIATIATAVAKNPALRVMFPARDNSFLQQLDARWKSMAPHKPAVVCGYEKKDTFGVRVVPWESATRFCDGQATPIQGADHLELVKPETSSHISVELLRNALDEYVVHSKVGARAVGMRVAFSSFPGLGNKFSTPPGLDLMLLDPREQGPFGFRPVSNATPVRFQHASFALPPPGHRMFGYVNRLLDSAYQVKAGKHPAIRTPLCLKVTADPLPADGNVDLQCTEGEQCVPTSATGPVVRCGAPERTSSATWLRWLPMASAAAAVHADTVAAAEVMDRLAQPAPGDWITPSLATLRDLRDKRKGRGYSEIVLDIDGLGSQEQADRVTYEATINGRRLWVNGNPSWANAIPHINGAQATLVLGMENLNATGANRGKEDLDIKIMLLDGTRTVATDSVRLKFTSLRSGGPHGVVTAGGRSATWSATYFPTEADRYQLLAYGGGQKDTLAAKRKLDDATVQVAGEDLGPVTGVVRPPNRDNPRWGLAVGTLLDSGQVRYSFDGSAVAQVCRALIAPEARDALRRAGFSHPEGFGVREVAAFLADDKPKALVPCAKFS